MEDPRLGMEAGDRVLGFFCLGTSDRIDAYRGSRGPIEDRTTWRS